MHDDHSIDHDDTIRRLAAGAQRLLNVDGPRYRRLWGYYRNPMRVVAVDADDAGTQRPYRQAQEWGLPSRITGYRSATELGEGLAVDGVSRKEVVIENDIGWRVDTMVIVRADYGKPSEPVIIPRKPKIQPYRLKRKRKSKLDSWRQKRSRA